MVISFIQHSPNLDTADSNWQNTQVAGYIFIAVGNCPHLVPAVTSHYFEASDHSSLAVGKLH